MLIFYDFETSQKDFLGQILSYYFVLVDEHYQPIKECAGLIQPNRLELPACGAILVNQLSIQRCLTEGQRECDAAITIHQFLQLCTQDHGHVPLVGFNSARFDFKHVEKLLLKHGLSPTFYGKITSLDIYQYSKYCALTEPDKFPFIKHKKSDTDRYSFRLEDLAKAFNCLDTPQTHDAKDDVLLTLSLTQALEASFSTSLQQFRAHQHNTEAFNTPNIMLKEPVFALEQIADTPIVTTNEWLVIGKASKSTYILLDIKAYHNTPPQTFSDYATITRYFNTRTTTFSYSTHPNTHDAIKNDPNIQKITDNALQYFKLFPVDWDIEYRPWAMGFDCIDTLRTYIERLHQNPDDYSAIISDWKSLKQTRPTKSTELHFMITLFNRYYLNHHPTPNPDHIQKYIGPRYVSGHMHRNPMDHTHPDTELATIEFHLTNAPKSSHEQSILNELKDYTQQFISHYLKS